MREKPQIIRIALHPRDPPKALEDQIDMISRLKGLNYEMLSYRDLTAILEVLSDRIK